MITLIGANLVFWGKKKRKNPTDVALKSYGGTVFLSNSIPITIKVYNIHIPLFLNSLFFVLHFTMEHIPSTEILLLCYQNHEKH